MRFPDWLQVYGEITWRGPCPPEAAEQVTFFGWLREQHPESWGRIAIHPRNEGVRTRSQAQREKSEGMAVGAADIIIPARVAFVCELKRQDHTKSQWQTGQLEYIQAAYDAGAFACVALGWQGAVAAFQHWLTIK